MLKGAKLERIDSFSGDWGFLSNFYAASVRLTPFLPNIATYPTLEGDDFVYPSVEHAYQAAKTTLLKEREKFTWAGLSPGQAKKMGEMEGLKKRGILRPDWFDINMAVMHDLLLQKFYPTRLRRKLFGTLDALLVEGNTWHDTFWGVCIGGYKCGRHEPIGENRLGQLLMDVRRYYLTS